jgi:hypothetical protein
MRYTYTITYAENKTPGLGGEVMHAMSWKKMLKSLLLKHPKFSGWCTYFNKHGHLQVKALNDGKIIHERKRNQKSD